MKYFFSLPVVLITNVLSEAPNIEDLPAAQLIGPKFQKINNQCYKAAVEFCNEGSEPATGCQENEDIVFRTNVLLENVKFVFRTSVFDKHIYEASPKKKNKKTKDLYVYKGSKNRSPIRLFLILREIECSIPSPQPRQSRNNENIRNENIQRPKDPRFQPLYDYIDNIQLDPPKKSQKQNK